VDFIKKLDDTGYLNIYCFNFLLFIDIDFMKEKIKV